MGFNAWPIRDVGDENVGWIQGRIVGPPPLVAPLSKRPCFYYSQITEGMAGVTDRAGELTIEDDTGRAIVMMAGAMIQVDYDHEQRMGGVVVHREGILGPGELIAAYGHCRWERDPDPNRARLYRDPMPMLLRVTQTGRVRVWVSEDVPERAPP